MNDHAEQLAVTDPTGGIIARDFFISYTSIDAGWAEWIAWQLEQAGYSVTLQAWDFLPGANFIVEMQRAVTAAARTIVVLSSAFLNSSFAQPEWAAAFGADPEGLKRKLLPVRVADCEPRGLLAQVVYIDLAHIEDETSARTELLTKVRAERLKPSRAPKFPLTPKDFPPSLPSHTHVRIGRKRFVYTQITAPGLEFVLGAHPYRDPIDPTDSEVTAQALAIHSYVFLPSSEVLLAPSLAPLTPLAAFCTPDDAKIAAHLLDTLGGARFAKLQNPPSRMMTEDKKVVIRAFAEVAERSLLTCVVLPDFVLEPVRMFPKVAYETMNHLFLVPLLALHRRLGVGLFQMTLMVDGKCRADALEATKKAAKTALRGIPHSTALAEDESARALCGVARTVAWCVQRFYHDGDRQWLNLLDDSLA